VNLSRVCTWSCISKPDVSRDALNRRFFIRERQLSLGIGIGARVDPDCMLVCQFRALDHNLRSTWCSKGVSSRSAKLTDYSELGVEKSPSGVYIGHEDTESRITLSIMLSGRRPAARTRSESIASARSLPYRPSVRALTILPTTA